MFQAVENRLFNQMRGLVHHVTPVAPTAARGLVAEVYAQLRAEFQLAPPLTLHSPAPRILAGAWSVTRESQIVPGRLSRPVKEAISVSVSHINRCPYCVDAHTGLLHGAAQHDVAACIRNGQAEAIADDRIREVVRWALATRQPNDPIVTNPPFSVEDATEAIGTALAYHYVNRMVHVFLGDDLLPLPSGFRGAARWVFGATFGKRMVLRGGGPGASLDLLPDAPLPNDLRWAKSNPAIAGAWARFAAVVEEAGQRVLPEHVRALLLARLAGWEGEEPEISAPLVDDAVASLDEAHRPAGRFVLLVALASYRVDQSTVEAFRRTTPGDRALVEASAWAALQAARRIGGWLQSPILHDRSSEKAFEPLSAR
ncbi:MAG: carboxymuconolactone decarboxylase family protein [Myxococcales bacterium]|nr:carboxymuconolactone decarboxylase family protein [Myxococcales bacterium]MDH3483878.1 carboxymuconolactone decarboxylase family protein [Myxococcales bacterium]